MANPAPNINFNSPWPGRLKALKKDESLLISKSELSYLQARALVTNMNYRWKGELLFSAMGANDTDTIVTCLFKGRNVVDDRRKIIGHKKRSAPKKAASKLVVTEPAAVAETVTPTNTLAIIETLHSDGHTQLLRAASTEHYERIMAETAQNTAIVQIKIFALTHTRKRDFSWKDETSPLKD